MATTFGVRSVGSVYEAIEQMIAIRATLEPDDGMAAFNRMYLAVTTSVGEAIRSGFFTNSVFLDRLDVVFANRYFEALSRAQSGTDVPRCWQVLWERRAMNDITPFQFAVAGMNAHINHDLVLAVVETLTEFGGSPRDHSMRSDFDRVNALLEQLNGDIRRSFEYGLMLRLERRWGQVEDRVDSWSIAAARAAAWDDAEGLWALREHDHLRRRYEQALDETVAIAGRCLLTPFGHAHDAHVCARTV